MTIDATGKRMDTMAKRTLIVGAMVLVTLMAAGTAQAEIPEPDHIFWGNGFTARLVPLSPQAQ